ncbi:MAG: ABC transporter substrate-binding protein [Erysipelotrichaceae bacterium]|uniref:ABC transporter substrate-binding protein n=1 Tax=Floccifex sp. TaxID=2815810 RepID=UPI002A760962|nr:ABC transporter substrate-binding protein [Floccifex sp.]MDD7280812.1 ABC transporter substrate-binding protein [Erysipelotrichaceae bacterium]MDY2958271.1 ABC transporter substrate-binding protein [Floccifex sp.]
MKKIIATGMAALMAVSMCACSDSGSNDTYNIGIVQLVQHPALDAATEGFQDALTEKLGDKVSFDLQNASGEAANCATIVNGFTSDGVDLILANATAPLQAAAAATSTIPVLGTSVTDYATALEIDDWTGIVGTNVSGTSDLAPLDEQAASIHELFPDAKTVGLLYCSAEPNSVYQCDTIKKILEDDYGYSVEYFSFTDSNDIASVTQTACEKSDVIYIPTDNTAANNTSTIKDIVTTDTYKTPIFAGEEGICSGCGVATLSISYYDLGYKTGEMAYEILVNGEDVSTMEVQFAPKVTKKYVKSMADLYGVTIPEGYEVIEE